MPKNALTIAILIAMLLGIGCGALVRDHAEATHSPEVVETFANNVALLSDTFMRLIKMIIAPLVFSTLVVGIAKLGDVKAIGRLGGKTLAYFFAASLLSLTLGLILVNLLEPGVQMHLPLPAGGGDPSLTAHPFDLKSFLHHIVPENIVQAMHGNEILQIVVFSIMFGIAAASIGEKAKTLLATLEAVGHIMLRITGYVMLVAPFAVFGAASGVIARKGVGVLATYGLLIGEFYGALLLLWSLLLMLAFAVVGRRTRELVLQLREPFVLAFSTASSEAAFPKILQVLERFGCPDRVAGFVLPLGYSFNLDGSMMYMTFAALFIAQAYGIHLAMPQQITLLLTLMLTSKGIAGVPRASLVVIAGALSMFDIPEAGLLLLLPIDHFLDMGRSATNVLGNSVAAVVMAKWERQLIEPEQSDEVVKMPTSTEAKGSEQ